MRSDDAKTQIVLKVISADLLQGQGTGNVENLTLASWPCRAGS